MRSYRANVATFSCGEPPLLYIQTTVEKQKLIIEKFRYLSQSNSCVRNKQRISVHSQLEGATGNSRSLQFQFNSLQWKVPRERLLKYVCLTNMATTKLIKYVVSEIIFWSIKLLDLLDGAVISLMAQSGFQNTVSPRKSSNSYQHLFWEQWRRSQCFGICEPSKYLRMPARHQQFWGLKSFVVEFCFFVDHEYRLPRRGIRHVTATKVRRTA